MPVEFAPGDEEERRVYRTLTAAVIPRPIGWISSVDADGRDNLAPYSFFNVVCVTPPIVMFSHSQHVEGRMKDTGRNVIETGEFVHNVVSESVAERMHETSTEIPPDESEFDAFDVERADATRVAPPRVADAPVAFECTLRRSIDLGSHSMILGDVEYVHLADSVVEGGELDLEKFDALGRLSAGKYTTTSPRFELDAVMGNVFLDDDE